MLQKNYDEFINMLRAFKKRGNGTIPITAAGLLNTETPYDLYLREFYQDANPDFYKDETTGKYVDGFSQPEMREAVQRLRDVYQEGLLDAEVVTNKSKTRHKAVAQRREVLLGTNQFPNFNEKGPVKRSRLNATCCCGGHDTCEKEFRHEFSTVPPVNFERASSKTGRHLASVRKHLC